MAADDAVISCMPSPCNGELGMGEKKKSSASPCIVETLGDVYVLRVGAGPAHSLYIVRNTSDSDKAQLDKFKAESRLMSDRHMTEAQARIDLLQSEQEARSREEGIKQDLMRYSD